MSAEAGKHRVLVVGSGSIGRRHLRNLRDLGCEDLAACDPDPDRLAPMVAELGVEPFGDFDEAMAATRPDLVFVCTPPVFHVSQALAAVRRGAHVFVEKPLSHTLEGVDELIAESDARGRIVQVGYNLRFHPGLREIKRRLNEGAVGRVWWVRAEVGQYLPDWRPWQDYRASYTARKELGGGILLDASHEIDYILWLLGRPREVVCMAGRVSNLQVDVEDCATVLLRFAGGAQADVHMDFVQHEYSRSCKLIGEKGTIFWDYPANRVRIDTITGNDQVVDYSFEANEMYRAEVEHFLTRVETREAPDAGLGQARETLETVLAAHRAAAAGRSIRLDS